LTLVVCTIFDVEEGGSRMVFAQTWTTAQSKIAFTALTCITGVNKKMAFNIITFLALCSPYDLSRPGLV
jgi:hypothetical protein